MSQALLARVSFGAQFNTSDPREQVAVRNMLRHGRDALFPQNTILSLYGGRSAIEKEPFEGAGAAKPFAQIMTHLALLCWLHSHWMEAW